MKFNGLRPAIVAGIVCTLGLLVACSLPPVFADHGHGGGHHGGDDGSEVAGIVTAVSGTTLPFTLTLQTASAPVTVNVTADTEFEVDGHSEHEGGDDQGGGGDDKLAAHALRPAEHDEDPGTPLDPTQLVGLFVQVHFDPTTNDALKIEAETEFELFGVVTAVGGPKAPTTITVHQFRGADVTLNVTDQTQLSVDDKQVTDLTTLVDEFVEAKYDAATGDASEIEVKSDDHFVEGTLQAIDVAGLTMTINGPHGSSTIGISATATVDLDGQAATLADLVVGDKIGVQFTGEHGKRLAQHIEAFTPAPVTLSGRVSGISTTAHTITVTKTAGLSAAAARTQKPALLKVNASTIILVNGHKSTFSAILPGSKVTTQYVHRHGSSIARKVVATLPRHP